jgi:hypothetical protein
MYYNISIQAEFRPKHLGSVLDLWKPCHIARPNSWRLINSSITVSCISTDLEKPMVLRAKRLIRVRKVKCLRSVMF